MAGINVPQYEIFKIGTDQLKYNNWDLMISKDDARKCNEMVSLFEAEEFRTISRILKKPIKEIDFSQYIASIVIDNVSDFKRATSENGLNINGINFKRFVGTTGGLKNHSILFVNSSVLDELNRLCECGREQIEIVPAKLEAYKALYCSASQPICNPKKIVVVPDLEVNIKSDIIKIDEGEGDEPTVQFEYDAELTNTVSDGFSLCTPEYMKRLSDSLGLNYVASGVCLRNAWLKGMLYPFPINDFIEKYNNGNYKIIDSWGVEQDLRECEMIVTESCLKLWKAYKSSEQYEEEYKKNGFGFSVTKIATSELEDVREVNYQYLQSYNFDDKDIEELCEPTVKYLKGACCGDYETTKEFLGIKGGAQNGTWQRALYTSEYMMGDPYIIDSTHRMIRKKIDQAKIGKLRIHGNYQIASGDPFALMQSVCGLEITGLLKAGQIYSSYWVEENVDEVVVFRSPMTSHNNIRKCEVVNTEESKFWYRYMPGVIILNGFDTMCQALNGCDYDGDLLFSTNNAVLLRRHKVLPASVCVQKTAKKIIPVEKDIVKTNRDGMGNKVGVITNRITTMMEVQSRFDEGTPEWNALQKRIDSGEKHQQDEIDRLKGIVAKPMPTYWYNLQAAIRKDKEDNTGNFQQSICVHKKPYFMIYVYEDYKQKYRDYINHTEDLCEKKYHCTFDELKNRNNLNDDELCFLEYVNRQDPFGNGKCSMNRICWHIEDAFKNQKIELKSKSNFDYRKLKYNVIQQSDYKERLKNLMNEYIVQVRNYKQSNKVDVLDADQKITDRMVLSQYYKNKSIEICKSNEMRHDIILDLCYGENGNKQFCWDCIGDSIIKRLEDVNIDTV